MAESANSVLITIKFCNGSGLLRPFEESQRFLKNGALGGEIFQVPIFDSLFLVPIGFIAACTS